jgi:membrane protease YdiL (CAAX protease family)
VIPQELIYRTFFFHRYGPLFGEARWLAVAVNGLLFGFAHIIFGSYVSIVLTALLGFLIAWRYERTRSFWGAWLEHTIYGCLIFTIGLGRYFFTGIGSVP